MRSPFRTRALAPRTHKPQSQALGCCERTYLLKDAVFQDLVQLKAKVS